MGGYTELSSGGAVRQKGAPKTKIAVESDDEKTPKKRGRPKKIKKGEPTDDELIAILLEQMS